MSFPKFTALAERMAAAIGANARVCIEPGSHAVHLDDADVIGRALAGFSEAAPPA